MYAISVEQTHGHMRDKPETHVWKREEITEICISPKHFTQIGFRTHCTFCRNVSIGPTWLTFPIYIDQNDENYEDVLNALNKITYDSVGSVAVTLTLDKLPEGNYQTIKIWKMKE